MTRRSQGTLIAWPAGLASAGVVAGHSAAYWLTAPAAHEHQRLLAATGHRYWSALVAVAIGAMVAGLARSAIRILKARPERVERRGLYWSVARRMALLQLGAFLLLETLERELLATDAHPSHLLQEPAVLVGLALQLVIALIGALLLVVWTGVVKWLTERCSPRSSHDGARDIPTVTTVARLRPLPAGITVRGPPST